MVEEPEPSVIDVPPAERVEPEMMYWECESGVIVSVPMVRAPGVVPGAEGMGEVRGP